MVVGAVMLQAVLSAGSFALPAHVRPRGPELLAAATEGYQRSAEFRRLVTRIGMLHGIVYVDPRPFVDPAAWRVLPGAMSHEVSVAGPYRFFRVFVQPRDRAVAVLAHELQHVVEVLESGATSTPEIERLFARIGWQAGGRVSETAEAVDVERRVARELALAARGRVY